MSAPILPQIPALPSPTPTFPLCPYTGRWAKKIRGKFHYFGPWSDPHGALAATTSRRTTWKPGGSRGGQTGVTDPDRQADGGLFLDAKEINVQSGEMEETPGRRTSPSAIG